MITLVLDMLGDFDSDKHSPGSYVVWDKEHSDAKVEEKEKDEKTRKIGKQKKHSRRIL